MTVQPVAPLPLETTVTVSIGGTVTDPAGNPVTVPSQGWNWHVPAFLPLGEALTVSPNHPNAESHSLQIDKEGRPIVAWVEGGSEFPKVHVRRWAGSDWEPRWGRPWMGIRARQLPNGACCRWTWTDGLWSRGTRRRSPGRRTCAFASGMGATGMPWGAPVSPVLQGAAVGFVSLRDTGFWRSRSGRAPSIKRPCGAGTGATGLLWVGPS
jgi:hypothetical protein